MFAGEAQPADLAYANAYQLLDPAAHTLSQTRYPSALPIVGTDCVASACICKWWAVLQIPMYRILIALTLDLAPALHEEAIG